MNPIPLQANVRARSLVKRADGDPIIAGTVNYYLIALTGANAGKWFRTSDNSWQAAEAIAGVMSHLADGDWSVSVDAEAWPTAGVEYTEYAKEDGDLHVPTSMMMRCEYAPFVIAPGAAGGVFIAGTNAATAITTALTANIIGNITGTLDTVTICTTTTTNSDMVGTNGANTTVPDAAGVVATALGDGSVILHSDYDAAKAAAQAGTALSNVTWTDAKAAFLDASIAAIPTTAMRGTDNAALAATALSTAVWTGAKAAFLDASIAAIPTTAMRGTDNAALAATALSTAVWTGAKAAFLDASIAAIPTVMVGTDNAALAATALSSVVWTNAKAAFVDASIAAIPTTAMRGTDNAALAATALSTAVWTGVKAAFLDASIAAIPTTAMRGTDNAALAATAVTAAQVNAQVLDVMNVDTLVAGVTIAEALRRIGAKSAGKISGAGTGTETITDWAGSISTIVFTVDASGNISAVVFT